MGVKLIGIDVRLGYGLDEKESRIIATFDNYEKAEQYIKNSRLKRPVLGCSPFKIKSLLSGCMSVKVEMLQGHLPHNPTI